MSRRASAPALEHAVEDFFLRQEFQLDYQPVVSLDKQHIGGFEALLHLRQERVPYYPADFIPVVEATSLRVPLARWILREACHQVQDWRRQNGTTPVSISVNVSPRQLFQGRILVHQLEHVLTETGMEPSGLHLEIPAVVSQQMPSLRNTLANLSKLGVRLYIDNFDPNSQALKVLSQVPVDAVKLCHSSLNNLETAVESLESMLYRA
ncbi:MAG: EAL domain-containing protein, partial [Cyanobacteria bacterium J06636_16]